MEPSHKPIRGAGWTFLAHVVTRGITFAASLALARLLDPSAFGLVAVAALVLNNVTSVTRLGLSGAVVVASRESAVLRASLTLLLLAGALSAAVIIGAAGWLADLFDEKKLEPVLLALSLTLVIGGVTTFYEALLQREIRFRALLLANVVRAVTYAAVTIGAAIVGAGVWSLVAGQLASALAFAVALVATAPYTVVPGLALDAARQAMRSAHGFLLQTVVTTLQHNVDVAAAAYVGGARSTGYYSMAWNVSAVPYDAITNPVVTAAFPTVAETHRRAEPTAPLGLELLAVLAAFASPLGAIMSATAVPLVATLFGPKWAPAAGALAVLGGWVAVVQVEAGLGWFLNAIGHSRTNAAISAAVTIPLIPAVFLAAHIGGIEGVAWAMFGSAVVASVAFMLATRSKVGLPLGLQLAPLRGVIAGCGVAWVTARVAVSLLAATPDAVQLLIAIFLGGAAYVATVAVLSPATLRHGMAFVAQSVKELRNAPAPA